MGCSVMVKSPKFVVTFLLALLLLLSGHTALAIWDTRVTYLGETLETGYSWSGEEGLDESDPMYPYYQLLWDYIWDDTAWDFIYAVELVDNDSADPYDHPVDDFQVSNPYGVMYTITHTPYGWVPPEGVFGSNETIEWMEMFWDDYLIDGEGDYVPNPEGDNYIYESQEGQLPSEYFAFKVAHELAHPGPGMVESRNLGHSNHDGSYVPVPEPGTLILLGSGLAGLGGFARLKLRRRRKS